MAAQQTSKADFTGVFTLRTPAEAQRLSDAVRGIIDKSVNIFFDVATNIDAAKNLIEDIETAIRLCAEFPELCTMDNTRTDAEEAMRKLAGCSIPILTLLRSHKPGTQFSTEDADQLASSLKKFLIVIARISDLMEDEQINRLMEFTTGCFQHVLVLKQTRSDFRIDNKLEEAQQAWAELSVQIEKRADVTEDAAIAARLRQANTQIKTYTPLVLQATKEVAANASADRIGAQEAALFEVAGGFQTLLAALKEGKVSGKASFEYDTIAESLDALRDAIKAGSTQAAVDSAAEIARELAALKQKAQEEADAEARRKLEESLAGLHATTARLLGATKEALADPTKAGALGGIIDQMKGEVIECSLVNTKKKNSTLRNRLVQCAAQLSSGIDDLADKTR